MVACPGAFVMHTTTLHFITLPLSGIQGPCMLWQNSIDLMQWHCWGYANVYLIYLWKGVSTFQKATAKKLFTLFPTVHTLMVGSVILWSHDTRRMTFLSRKIMRSLSLSQMIYYMGHQAVLSQQKYKYICHSLDKNHKKGNLLSCKKTLISGLQDGCGQK